MKIILYNCVSLSFILLAGFMIYHQVEGWGWCLFCALMVTVFPKNEY